MIRTNNLRFQYPKSEPIDFPDIQVEAGKTLLIYGESGCGKTTFLHLLAGLRKPTSGHVFIDNEDISSYSAAKLDQFRGENIGIVFQQSYVIESMTVKDNLNLSPFQSKSKDVKEIARQLNIENILDKYPKKLSVGQKQRVSMARAVMNSPKLILADEPTSNLDNKNCKNVIELLKREAESNNAALIVVSHDDRLMSQIDNCIEL